MNLQDLTGKSPQEWDTVIAAELEEAGIEVRKFREYDSSGFWVKHSLKGALGEWIFRRNAVVYLFWGDIPLATAEAIAADKACAEGCMPRQWMSVWGDRPDPSAVHAKYADHIKWIAGSEFLIKDEGQSDKMKEVLQKDSNWKLRFVADPSDPKEGGKPFIQTYTFFTLSALKKFVEIARRHRLP